MKRGSGAHDGVQVSIYFPVDLMSELEQEAKRLDRSVNWVVQRCLKHGLVKVRGLQSEERGAA